jgi:uncharacterized membrane protein SpoIIM required for sporulation
MVLESITNPFSAQKHAATLFVVGLVYSSVALFLANWIFQDHAGIVMVLLVVLASVPLFYKTMKYAENSIQTLKNERDILVSHAHVVRFFIFFFVGMTFGFTFWYVALEPATATSIFDIQTQTIANLNQQVTGGVAHVSLFGKIFFNNLKVMIFSLFFSFLFGSGAIFILTWNSSVIGAAAGNFIKVHAAQMFSAGSNPVSIYAYAGVLSVLRYFIHGIPEILAYFVAGLAGGILSVAIIRRDLSKNFDRIMLDFSDLLVIALLFLVAAGLLEVFVTPAVMSVL